MCFREDYRLLKKSLSERSVVPKQAQTPPKQVQDIYETGFSVPEQGSRKGTREFFNTLTTSRQLVNKGVVAHEEGPGSDTLAPAFVLGLASRAFCDSGKSLSGQSHWMLEPGSATLRKASGRSLPRR
jgi:hypothetical protein